jgi:protein TonB
MTGRIAPHRVGLSLGWMLLVSAAPAFAQEGLSKAKDFYASASYEEALAVLSSLHGKTSPPETTDVARYEVFCLVALGRGDDAKPAIETIVRAEPEYHLSEGDASPRVRAMFDALRKPLLPAIIKESYARGRDAFDRKDLPAALKEFDRVIALEAELEPAADQSLRDVKALASGFRDLGRMASAAPAPTPPESSSPATPNAADPSPAPAPPPAAVTTARPAAAVSAASVAKDPPADPRRTFGSGDAGVKPPVPVSQVFPPWRPMTTIESKRDFQGAVDLLIDEQGHVVSAAIVKSVQDRYDEQLLEAARRWTFRPAVKDGHPVPYRSTVAVNLLHTGR